MFGNTGCATRRTDGALPGRRAMRGVASPARESRPSSLIVRLAQVAGEVLPQAPQELSTGPRRTARSLGTSACFGLGALASVAIGGVAFLGLQALAASETRVLAELGVEHPALGKAAAVASWRQPQIFEIAIARRESAQARLGLRVVGINGGNLENFEIVLHGVPATATLSRGERRDAVTWVLRGADLDDLHLSLGEATPEAFDIRIDVVAPLSVPTIGSIARIRVVDSVAREKNRAAALEAPARQGGPAAGGTSVAKSVPVQQAAAAIAGPAAAADAKAKRPGPERRPAPEAGAAVAAPQAAASARPWPEGASALGATSRESERQVWWTMPQPSWSPFPAGTQ